METLNRSWPQSLEGKQLSFVKSSRSPKLAFTPPLYTIFHLSYIRVLRCRPSKEGSSHFTGERTNPQRKYLRSKSRKLQSELNSVSILSVTGRSKLPSKPVLSLLSFLPSSLCTARPLPSFLFYCFELYESYHGDFLLHSADFSPQPPKTPASLPSNSMGHFFYFVAFLEECFSVSYFKIKSCTTPESFTGCPCAILAAVPVWLSGTTCSHSAFQLGIFRQFESLFLHFTDLCFSF